MIAIGTPRAWSALDVAGGQRPEARSAGAAKKLGSGSGAGGRGERAEQQLLVA